ncbi:MAG: stress response translation initiation inhibitor YciH [Thermoplasmata archaeon]|nr:stress response translation initiation inhibitor YciH [Thermoplasmata archaeon]MCJ7562864.1 stress response translation initiation inhibitor YciH [Thermoplasmata archaeon]TFG70677.1 MAG: stress response translation initiation inhibitor YciH [Methanomassiliicoccus sp.]
MAGICSVCGLPEELCMCEQIAKEQQQIRILTDTRRYGKVMTVIVGINSGEIDMEDLARKLKTRCASGGTYKDGKIELQGDHKKKVKDVLEELGFSVDSR